MQKRTISKIDEQDLPDENNEDLVITTKKITKSKGGRPKVENKADKKEQTYLTEQEQQELVNLSEETGKSKAKLIREAIVSYYDINDARKE